MDAGKDYVVITLAADGQHSHTPVHVDEFVGETGKARVRVGAQTYEIVSNSRLNDTLNNLALHLRVCLSHFSLQ